MSTSPRGRRWILWGVGLGLLAMLLYWFWQGHGANEDGLAGIDPDVDVYDYQEFLGITGRAAKLEYVGKPLPGRPEVPMPLLEDVYKTCEFRINGKPVQPGESLRFRAGSKFSYTIHAEALPKIPAAVGLSEWLGLVTRSDNAAGWVVTREQPPRKSVGSLRSNDCEGEYLLPDEPGESLLVILSTAHVGQTAHPCLMAMAYPLEVY